MNARRQQRQQQRAARARTRTAAINLVSLIDIFAILVFYLLVNALVVETIPAPKLVQLPAAAIETLPKTRTTVTVTMDEVRVGDQRVQATAQLLAGNSAALQAALAASPLAAGAADRGEINILADKRLSYRALREVMQACSASRYAQISLAVVEKPQGGGA